MKVSKDSVYSNNSFFWIPVYYDKNNDIYFCEPESKDFINSFYEWNYWDKFGSKRSKLNIFFRLAFVIIKIPDLLNYRNFQILKNLWYINKWSKILEIWVWEWKNLMYLKKLWYEIHGVEMDADNVKKINSYFNEQVVFQWSYEDIQIVWKYDIIYMRHVLEHFLNLDTVISNLKRNLNDGWIVFVDVPYCESDFTLNWSIQEHPHIYHFTRKSLNNYFKEYNFHNQYLEFYIRKNILISRISIVNKIYIFILMLFKAPSYKTWWAIIDNQIYDLVWIFKLADTK